MSKVHAVLFGHSLSAGSRGTGLPTWPGTKAIALEQSNSIGSSDFDRVNDIAPAFGAIAFGDVGTGTTPGPYRDQFLSAMPTQGLVFGWPSYNEVDVDVCVCVCTCR